MNTFERYLKSIGKQEEVEEKKIEVIANPNLEAIVKAYEVWLEKERKLIWSDKYHLGVNLAKKSSYYSKDVSEFSIRIKQYEEIAKFEYTGFFLSALINSSEETEFEIVTEHLKKPVNYIGYENQKIVDVKGNAGTYSGWEMKSGKLIIKGYSGDCTGYLMSGGEIIIEGNAGNYTGSGMKNGTMQVAGKIEHISQYFEGDKIYEQGKLVRGEE